MLPSWIARLLSHKGSVERYPTRTVEHSYAWMIIVWSLSLVAPGEMLTGNSYRYLVELAPEILWGLVGITLGASRLFALYLNGNWRRSPALRFLGAMSGLIWWLLLWALYTTAVKNGAPDFPMRHCFLVFIVFEAYSCYRCGQDHRTANPLSVANGASENG